MSKLDGALAYIQSEVRYSSGKSNVPYIAILGKNSSKQAIIDIFKEIVDSSDRDGVCPTKALLDKIGEL